tara:strand:- start:6713 stop:7516 length:804 start_codon:yes stop_codon:yes gene_type:complete
MSSSGFSVDSGLLDIDVYEYLTQFLSSPITLLIISILIILVFTLGKGSDGSSGSASILEIIVWSVFTLLVLLNGFLYFFGIEITTYFDKFMQGKTTIGIDVEDKGLRDQVFHIRDNKYSYPDAQAICKAYGGRLANYNDIEDAYKAGAEWCSYGWSDDQMALFPTQYDTWADLQSKSDCSGQNNDCGRPGINGGFIANPFVRFGVNCYGKKPRITEDEQEMMDESSYYPTDRKDQLIDKRADYWNEHLDDLTVAPFNYNKWNKYNQA